MRHISHSLVETSKISLILANKLRAGDVVFLRGSLGSGKTTLMKGVAKHFGIHKVVRSPTFVLAKPYRITRPLRSRADRLVHIDAYRMTSAADLDSVGWNELAGHATTIVAVENPGRLFGRYRPSLTVHLRTFVDGRRLIEF